MPKGKKQSFTDSDVIPESPEVQIKKKNKRRVIHDDEEIFSKRTNSNHEKKSDKKSNSKSPKSALKQIAITDMFAGAIKKTEPIVKKIKKTTEAGIHSDDEFEKSLLELDECDELQKAEPAKVNTLEPAKLNANEKSEYLPDEKHEIKKPNKEAQIDLKQNSKIDVDTQVTVKKSNKDSPIKTKSIKLENGKNGKKRDFSEFTEGNSTISEEYEEETKQKKRKLNKSLNESVLTDEERHERKIYSATLYKKYLHRSGPKHLGSKAIPEGTPDCLKNCTFILTGVLDSFERDEITDAITKYGGTVKNGISQKVTHMIAGEDGGPAKMAKARDLGIKILNEDEFLDMIKELSSNKSKLDTKPNVEDGKVSAKVIRDRSPRRANSDKHAKSEVDKHKPKNGVVSHNEFKLDNHVKKEKKTPKKMDKGKIEVDVAADRKEVKADSKHAHEPTCAPSLMWVDKYKPQSVKQIIGQQGDASNVKRLTNWLTKWYTNRKGKIPKPSPWAKNDDGAYYKAALLSGPPGVGKTTTVSLVCKELGFDMVELNASDTRSKSLIKEQIGDLLTTSSLSAYANGSTGKQAVTKKHVLVMDEVDGMAGNEDRGGLQELIGLIKTSAVPIVCMCNDRNSQKMRSLVNYCYDLRFARPRVEQIKAAMMSICFKEGLKVPGDVMTQVVSAAGQDVRQTLHLLSVWAASAQHAQTDANLADTNQLQNDAKKLKLDIKMGPWEAIRKVFSAEEHKKMSIHDKSDLFFTDYSLMPLFVQENYLQAAPHCPKKEILDRLSEAADNISLGDLVDARIRGSQAWSLLPLQALYSSVLPGAALSGHVAGQIQFPGWLGKNSRRTKMHRLCQEIHAHTRLSTTGSKSSIFLDYAPHLRDAIVSPLIKDRSDGIEQSLEVLESYNLMREDLDSLSELSLWPGQRNPTILIDSKVKAAMTRTYNKKSGALPYAPAAVRRARPAQTEGDGNGDGDGYGEDEDDSQDVDERADDSDPEKDALIKKSKSTDKAKSEKSSKQKASCSKDNKSKVSAKDTNKKKR